MTSTCTHTDSDSLFFDPDILMVGNSLILHLDYRYVFIASSIMTALLAQISFNKIVQMPSRFSIKFSGDFSPHENPLHIHGVHGCYNFLN